MRDRCGDAWTLSGPELADGLYRYVPAPDDDPGYREVRGGSFHSTLVIARAASRLVERPDQVWPLHGFRLARPVQEGGV